MANGTSLADGWAGSEVAPLTFSACTAAPPDHRYGGGGGTANTQWSGLLFDWGAGPQLPGKLLDGEIAAGAASVNGTLVVPLPGGGAADGGLTLRLLTDSSITGVEWAGFTAYQLPDAAGWELTNALTRAAAAVRGPGSLTQPHVPFLPGEYTTIVLGLDGTSIYAGARAWATVPSVALSPSQNRSAAPGRVVLGDANLYDFQVYDAALAPAQIIALAHGQANAC